MFKVLIKNLFATLLPFYWIFRTIVSIADKCYFDQIAYVHGRYDNLPLLTYTPYAGTAESSIERHRGDILFFILFEVHFAEK